MTMPIFRALGLGIFLLVISLMVPSVFAQLQDTLIAFLHAGEVAADTASLAAASGSSSFAAHPPALPTAPFSIPAAPAAIP